MNTTSIIQQLEPLKSLRGAVLQQKIATLLEQNIPHYHWVGFYFMNDENQTLVLGPYEGAATDHTHIPYGRGICGQVAVSGKTFEVPDVSAEDNYLSCSIATKSEIVVPLYAAGKLVGQLDIDSHHIDPFTQADHELLERVCAFVAERL